MARKDFRILIALPDSAFTKAVVTELRKFYSVQKAKDINHFSNKIHKTEFDLIIVDYKLSNMKPEDVTQGAELFHPNAVFIVYTEQGKEKLAMRTWKRRAFDYILYTDDVYNFTEEVHKSARWTLQKRIVSGLGEKIDVLSGSIQEFSKQIEDML